MTTVQTEDENLSINMYPLASTPQEEQVSSPKEIIEWNIVETEIIDGPVSDIIENTIEPITTIEDINETLDVESNINIDIITPDVTNTVKEDIEWAEIEKIDIAEKVQSSEQDNLITDTKIEPLDVTEIEVGTIKTVEIDPVYTYADTIVSEEESVVVEKSLREEPSNEMHIWKAKRGSDLKEILLKWSDEEQIKLTWNLPDSHKIDKDIFISATFKNAIDVLFSKGLKNTPKYKLSKSPSYELIIGK